MKTKENIISNVNKLYRDNKYVVVVNFKGLNAADTSSLRGNLKKCSCNLLVVKNTLSKISSKGTSFEKNVNFKGQCGLIFCNDLLNVSKVIDDFCFKSQKVKLVSCLKEGELYSEENIKELASLPSIEVIRTKLLYVLKAVGTSIVRAIAEKVKQQGGELTNE